MSSPDPHLVEQLDQSLRDAAAQTVLLHQALADRLGLNLTAFECFTLLSQHGAMPAGQPDLPRLALRAEANLPDLYRVEFDGPPPRARVQHDGTINLRFRGGFRTLAEHGTHLRADVALSANVPWHVEVHGGLGYLEV